MMFLVFFFCRLCFSIVGDIYLQRTGLVSTTIIIQNLKDIKPVLNLVHEEVNMYSLQMLMLIVIFLIYIFPIVLCFSALNFFQTCV